MNEYDAQIKRDWHTLNIAIQWGPSTEWQDQTFDIKARGINEIRKIVWEIICYVESPSMHQLPKNQIDEKELQKRNQFEELWNNAWFKLCSDPKENIKEKWVIAFKKKQLLYEKWQKTLLHLAGINPTEDQLDKEDEARIKWDEFNSGLEWDIIHSVEKMSLEITRILFLPAHEDWEGGQKDREDWGNWEDSWEKDWQNIWDEGWSNAQHINQENKYVRWENYYQRQKIIYDKISCLPTDES